MAEKIDISLARFQQILDKESQLSEKVIQLRERYRASKEAADAIRARLFERFGTSDKEALRELYKSKKTEILASLESREKIANQTEETLLMIDKDLKQLRVADNG